MRGLKNGDVASSAIKQVASGRFGVRDFVFDVLEPTRNQGCARCQTGRRRAVAREKSFAVYCLVEKIQSRCAVDFSASAPRHLLHRGFGAAYFDLHAVNPEAKVSVKLVGQAGIGTVASGVAKANADIIQISGGDGGTGASPLSSIKHCGGPVELGLVESHRALVENGLRGVVLRADGGCRSGLDVMQWALMGADEFGFGTVAMIATGLRHGENLPHEQLPGWRCDPKRRIGARFPARRVTW